MKLATRSAWGNTLALLFVLTCGTVRPASASIVYVNKNAPGAVHDGASWATAFIGVQPAINAAASGDEVWVAASAPAAPAYVEIITLKEGVPLYGGFAGNETTRSQRDWRNNTTVLNGWGNTSTVVTSRCLGAVLDGFTVRGGTIGIDVSLGTASISDCWIGVNSICVQISNHGNAIIDHCTVSENRVGVEAVNFGTASITNCSVSRSTDYGVYVNYFGLVNITNCTFSGNARDSVYSRGTTTITNCIVAFNRWGIIWENDSPAPLALCHNDVFGNEGFNYSGLTDPTGSNGNISKDPLFVNRTSNDYHLLPGSPCIDAGDDSAFLPGETDIVDQPRRLGAHVDIGAYEFAVSDYFTLADAALALRAAAGIGALDQPAYARLNVAIGSPSKVVVDVLDAVAVARKASGLEANP